MTTKKLAHSYSAIKQFENCPKQYYEQRIARSVKPSFGDAAVYGIEVHESLEHRVKEGAILPAPLQRLEPICKAFTSMPGEILGEQEYTLNNKLTPTGWWDDDAWLRAKLDVLVLNGDKAVVGDWKTGKRRPDFSQLEQFALQVFAHHPNVQTVRSSFIWIKDTKMDSMTYERADTPAMWNTLLGRIRRIEASLEHNNWPARPSGLCSWCPAKDICEFYNGK